MKQINRVILAALLMQAALLGAETVTDEKNGFSITLPAGWSAQQFPLGFALGSPKHEGGVLVIPHTTTDFGEMKKLSAEGFVYKPAVDMQAAGPVQVSGTSKLSVDLTGTMNGQPVKGRMVVGMSPNGGGLIVLAAAPQAQYSAEYAAIAEAVLASARYLKREAAPALTATGAAKEWTARLSGKKLHYFHRYSGGLSGGMADHKQLGLCSDGSFFFRGDFSASINVPGATGNSSSRDGNIGRWQVKNAPANAVLQLTFANGGQASYNLGTDGSKTFLNGTRWLVEDAKECR